MTYTLEEQEVFQGISRDAKEFSKKHIVEMCEEMLEWTNTSILRNGRVRELARMLKPLSGAHYALSTAEGYVKHAAFEHVAQQGKVHE